MTINKGSEHFNVVTYSGTDSTQSITGVGFQPDFVWIKNKTSTQNHLLVDSVRGANKSLQSSTTNTEGTITDGRFTSFDSDGFTVASNDLATNASSNDYVAWCWKAGGSGVSNTSGSITSTVSVNPTAGFSIVTYTSPNDVSNQTVGHGLGVKPSMIIVKSRDGGINWDIYHSSLGYNASLMFTIAGTRSGAFGAEPNNTVFTTTNTYTHNNTDRYVAYCWAAVEGYSAFGSYSGSTGKVFVYTGFRPAFVLLKKSSEASTTYGWPVVDNSRPDGYNDTFELWADQSVGGSSSNYNIDLLSNGFCINATNNTNVSGSGKTYIYAAFAENPFKVANAR